MEDLKDFLDIGNHLKQLEERTETRRAVDRMLKLIQEACDYVRESTHPGYFREYTLVFTSPVCLIFVDAGGLFDKTYKEKIDGFKNDLKRTKGVFDRTVNLAMFKAIDGIGESLSKLLLRY